MRRKTAVRSSARGTTVESADYNPSARKAGGISLAPAAAYIALRLVSSLTPASLSDARTTSFAVPLRTLFLQDG
jgi:hypothetical protein